MQTLQEAEKLIDALDPKKVARKFSMKLVKWLSPDQMRQVRRDNLGEDPKGGPCSSHDYCDANQAMLDVFEELGLENMGTEGPAEEWPENLDDKFNDLWTKAWTIAKGAHFKAKDIKS